MADPPAGNNSVQYLWAGLHPRANNPAFERVDFLLKTDSGHPNLKDAGVTTLWQSLGIPLSIT